MQLARSFQHAVTVLCESLFVLLLLSAIGQVLYVLFENYAVYVAAGLLGVFLIGSICLCVTAWTDSRGQPPEPDYKDGRP